MSQISVIVPVYEVEKNINRCVDSILAQTFTDFELILINDGSTDQSVILCQRHESNRVRIIKQPHQVVVFARRVVSIDSKVKVVGLLSL